MKRFISALLSLVMAISLLAYLPIQVEAYEAVTQTVYSDWDLVGEGKGNQFNARKYLKENGTFNYHAWSQGQLPWGLYKIGNRSENASFCNVGCLVTAYAKIAVQSGNYNIHNMDPGIMNELLQKNGCFYSGKGGIKDQDKAAKLIGFTRKSISYSSIVSELRNDNNKQFIIGVKTKDGDPHWVPVNNELTLKYGSVYVDNSGREGGRTESIDFEAARLEYSTGVFSTHKQYVNELVGKTLSQLDLTVECVYMFTGPPSKVTINFHSNNTVGTTGDTWLYPAFKIQSPGYINSKITTVGYTVKTESGKEIYKFEETYNKGVNKDGEPYTYFGDRTDGKANMDLEKDIYNVKRNYLTDERIEPGQKYKVKGFVVYDGKPYESSEYTMSTTGTKINVTIEPYKTSAVGITGDNWLYPAFKVTVPNYRNSGITTVGYTVTTIFDEEIFKFEETYRSGVNKDGTSYKNTFFGARTDGGANMDLEKDVYNVKCEYLTDLKFISGHSYLVTGFVIFDGKRYESPDYVVMRTTGESKCVWREKVISEGSCTKGGEIEQYCRTCGTITKSWTPAKGHTPGTAATCTSPQKCTECGTQLAPATGHKWNSGSVTKQPTCTESGVKTYTCSSCGTTRSESVAPNGHTPGAEATCTAPQKCTDCGTQLASPTQHNFDNGIITKHPTCLEDGIKTYTCSSCGTTRTELFGGGEHIRGEAATCTSPQICIVCETQLAPALGHNYSGSYYYSAHPHEEYQKCTRCNAEKKTGNTKKVTDCSICYPTVTFTITYNANGGTGAPASQTKESGKALTLSSAKPTRQGYTFLGWATSSGASSAQYNAGSSFTTDANTTLYAVWRKDVVATGAQIVVGNVSGKPGNTVEVPISLKNNPGLASMALSIEYNSNVMALTRVEDSGKLGTTMHNKNMLVWENDTARVNFTVNGEIVRLYFTINPKAEENTYKVTVKYDNSNYDIVNVDLTPVQFDVIEGAVRVTNVLCGDLNGDGQVNSMDRAILSRHVAKWEGYETIDEAAADVDGDGRITIHDRAVLSRHVAKWDGYLELPCTGNN